MTTVRKARVAMPDGSTHVLTRLLSQANHKQAKGIGYLSVGLTLTPRATSAHRPHLVLVRDARLRAACFADYDRLAWPQNKRVAVAQTRLLTQDPEMFLVLLMDDLARESTRGAARRHIGVPPQCRFRCGL